LLTELIGFVTTRGYEHDFPRIVQQARREFCNHEGFQSSLASSRKLKSRTIMKHYETISVACYAGYKGDESPRRFSLKGKKHVVREVIARWHERDSAPLGSPREYFRVLDVDKREYVLRHTVTSDMWELVREERRI